MACIPLRIAHCFSVGIILVVLVRLPKSSSDKGKRQGDTGGYGGFEVVIIIIQALTPGSIITIINARQCTTHFVRVPTRLGKHLENILPDQERAGNMMQITQNQAKQPSKPGMSQP